MELAMEIIRSVASTVAVITAVATIYVIYFIFKKNEPPDTEV